VQAPSPRAAPAAPPQQQVPPPQVNYFQCVAQYVTVYCSSAGTAAAAVTALPGGLCCSVLQGVAVCPGGLCCSELQCVAVAGSTMRRWSPIPLGDWARVKIECVCACVCARVCVRACDLCIHIHTHIQSITTHTQTYTAAQQHITLQHTARKRLGGLICVWARIVIGCECAGVDVGVGVIISVRVRVRRM